MQAFLTPAQLLAYLGKIRNGKLNYLIRGQDQLGEVLAIFPSEYRRAVLATLGLELVCDKIMKPADRSVLRHLPPDERAQVFSIVLKKISLPELYMNMYGLGFLLLLATGWIRLIAKLLHSNNIVTEETVTNATLLSLTGTAVFYCYKNYQIWATRNLEFPKEFVKTPETRTSAIPISPSP